MVTLDLIGDLAIEIGATYDRVTVQLCNADDLTAYTGVCHVKTAISDTTSILTPTIEITNKDTFKIIVPFSGFGISAIAGNYIYDVLFTSATRKFYAIGGKVQLIARVTKL